MRRVAIIGSGGAGKSQLARQLGALTGLPVVHLDREFWRPGWQETPRDEWLAKQRQLVSDEAWIIDGNYGGTMDLRLASADTVIFLDLPRLVCIWRVIRRRFSSMRRGRPDMAEGLQDKLDVAFLRWIWSYPRTRRPGILERLAHLPSTTRVVRLRNRQEVAEFMAHAS
jgi:adenylate kinase family enzyme